MISVKILADSINLAGVRITSWLLTYPRFIHSEFMTHRIFSRNAASSRAIPWHKMVNAIGQNPAMPERWGAEQKGMKSGDQISEEKAKEAWWWWLKARDTAMMLSDNLQATGLHKSLCNRILEPFSHITVLATATDHRNFFALRAHPDAMPEFQVLAYRMLDQYLKNEPQKIEWGGWHIPRFGNPNGPDYGIAGVDGIKIATARCARLSYLTFDGDHDPAKDIELHDRLLASGHLSPFEHCAQATDAKYLPSNFDSFECNGVDMAFDNEIKSFEVKRSGWMQYRKRFPEENRTCVDYDAILATKPDWITL